MFYTGIGSRKTPFIIQQYMSDLAARLSLRGWVLRSGGAPGADTAFELYAREKEIYLPWKRFNRNLSPLCEVSKEAIEESLKFHPTADILSDGVRKIMGRNLYQILGQDLQTPSRFVVCWTPFSTEDAFNPRKRIGGTGQALRIARHHTVPIYNLREEGVADRLLADLRKLER